ncbi:MAG TPA: hypothetical protein VGI20_08020 [Rhizomicrobium sp.]|jgi:hypothetical protein
MRISGLRRRGAVLALATWIAAVASAGAAPVDILTYHYDNFRTGWNSQEKKLTPANVGSSRFQMLASTALDDQVDAQPLILASQSVNGNSAREIVYVVTEGDTVYAIDANTGSILLQRNLGVPVPRSTLPGQCTNGGPNLGINATPVMDPTTHTLYLIAYFYENQLPVARVYALDPSTLSDVVAPVVISATRRLDDRTKYKFDPHEARNRAGLLLANGNLYAGFASYCDYDANLSRGWVLGWQAGTLTPLPANEFTDRLAHSTSNWFMSTIWMSGYGLAGSAAGDVYFTTGNSDPAGDSYDPKKNISESVVQMPSDLSSVKHLYTPMGANGWQYLDETDGDFAAGGIMLLPPQKGQPGNLAVSAAKAGIMYVFNADDLTNGQANGGKEYSSVNVGPCWCGPSYYKGSDGVGRVVSSSNNTVGVWKIKARGTPSLTLDKDVGGVEGAVFPGFFTSVSSNGTNPGTTVIWAVGRPTDFNQEPIYLHAYDAENGGQLFTALAGYWTNSVSDSNAVPVVDDGKVYVASVKSLAIFGLKRAGMRVAALVPPVKLAPAPLAPGQHEIRGTLRRFSGTMLYVEKRDGRTIEVDMASAAAHYRAAPPSVGHALVARGTMEGDVLKAEQIGHVPDHVAMWPPDR